MKTSTFASSSFLHDHDMTPVDLEGKKGSDPFLTKICIVSPDFFLISQFARS